MGKDERLDASLDKQPPKKTFRRYDFVALRIMLAIIVISIFVLSITWSIFYRGISQLTQNEIQRTVMENHRAITSRLEAHLNALGQIPIQLAAIDETLLNHPQHEAIIMRQMKAMLETNSHLLDIYTVYKPSFLPRGKCPFWVWLRREPELKQQIFKEYNYPGCSGYNPARPLYDYTQDIFWYAAAIRAKKFVWGPPNFDEPGVKQYVISGVTPIHNQARTIVGVAGIDIPLTKINDILSSMAIGKSGYQFVLGPKGEYLAHTHRPNFVSEKKSIYDIQSQNQQMTEQIQNLGNAMTSRKQSVVEMVDPIFNEPVLISFAPLEIADFSIATVLPVREIKKQANKIGRTALISSIIGFFIMTLLSVLVASNMATRKEIGDKLREAKEAVEHTSNLKTQFLDIAAHELKTPVTAFSLQLQLAEKKLEKGEPITITLIKNIRSQVSRLTRLVVDLLDVSRLERGTITLHRERTDLVVLIKQALEEIQALAPKRQFTFMKPNSAISVLEIDVDAVRIRQVLLNLLDNAIKYTPDDSPIEILLEMTNDVIRVSVIDHGSGVSKELQQQLFQPLVRGQGDQVERVAGLGLGLFVCREIMKLHNGIVGVHSEQGHGSTFFFEFPKTD